ncbi:MAG TPA: hypothetical protein VNH83_12115, partial [Bryobacteraceae bacterium]|nr:hypothetical protein [Bryobacteraceae bacterium]
MKALLALLVTCAICAAQPATTQITDTVYNQDSGLPFSGSLTVSLTSGSIVSGTYTVLRSLPRKTISNGALSIALVPNDTATPANTAYTFAFSNGSSLTCTIPTSSTPIKLGPYCVPGAPFTPSPTVLLSWLNVSGAANGQYCNNVVNGHIVGLTSSCPGGGGGGGGGLSKYIVPMSGTSVTVLASTHGLGVNPALVSCRSAAGLEYEPGAAVVNGSGDITITST